MNRSISADLIKSISIFAVVYIHGATLFGCASNFTELSRSFFRFCVPCFIIIFAYFFETSYAKKTKQERKAYINSRLKHLFVIFFLWSTLYFLMLVDWNDLTFQKLITKYFSGYGFAGQYFFIVLFQIIALFPLLRWMYTKKPIRYLTILFMVVVYVLYGYFGELIPNALTKLGDRPFVFWIPHVFTGIALSRNEIKKISPVYSLMIVLIAIEAYLLKNSVTISEYIRPVVLLSSIVFCTALLQNSIEIKSNKLNSIIKYIGKNTMTIFVANPLVIILSQKVIPNNFISNPSVFQLLFVPFLSAIFVFSICIAITEIINHTKLKGVIN